jgi:serine/threonine protein kinase
VAQACPHCGAAHDDRETRCPTTGLPIGGDPKLVGTTLANRYQLVRLLGDGGMGAVYKAADQVLRRFVAIKLLHPAVAQRPAAVERFQREARAAAAIGHPNIIDILDFGVDRRPYMVMEYLRGRSLSQVLAAEGALPIAQAVAIAAHSLAGLAAAHERGILHRDLKPANLMLVQRFGDKSFVKVCDFGFAALMGPTSAEDGKTLTPARTLVGTPAYASPERLRGDDRRDPRVDLYSIGVVLFEMIAGRRPFDGETFRDLARAVKHDPPPHLTRLRVDVPPKLDEVVQRALSKEPDGRFRNAGEFAAALVPFGGRSIALDDEPSDSFTFEVWQIRQRDSRKKGTRPSIELPHDASSSSDGAATRPPPARRPPPPPAPEARGPRPVPHPVREVNTARHTQQPLPQGVTHTAAQHGLAPAPRAPLPPQATTNQRPPAQGAPQPAAPTGAVVHPVAAPRGASPRLAPPTTRDRPPSSVPDRTMRMPALDAQMAQLDAAVRARAAPQIAHEPAEFDDATAMDDPTQWLSRPRRAPDTGRDPEPIPLTHRRAFERADGPTAPALEAPRHTEPEPRRTRAAQPAHAPRAAPTERMHPRIGESVAPDEVEEVTQVTLLVRGAVVLAALRFVGRRFGERSVKDVIDALDSVMRRPFDEGIDPDRWYPGEHFTTLAERIDAVHGRDDLHVIVELGRAIAESAFEEMRKLRPPAPPIELLLAELPRITRGLIQGAETAVRRIGRGYARIELVERASPSLTLAVLVLGFVERSLGRFGAADVEVNLLSARALDDAETLLDISWIA